MTLDEFVGQGWQDHGNDAEGVWNRLPDGVPLVDSPASLFKLAHLATHVAGEHLGRWDDGLAFLDRLASQPAFDAAAAEGKGVRRLQGVLEYCAGRLPRAEERLAQAQPGAAIRPESTRIRLLAVAAGALAHHGRMREAAAAFEEALALAAYGPDKSDPAARDLAVTGNNLAVELENLEQLDDDGGRLMLRAAAAGRRYWEISGTWMEVERAEYRLALSHVKAGLVPQALRHAQECLRIVEANGSDPGESFFAHEATARVRLAAGESGAARSERDAAAAVLPQIGNDGFRSFCAEELEKLDAILAGR